MIAHLWQLRTDVLPLEEGARQWARLSGELAATGDDIVAAARRALDQGWESEAAESYEEHRRRMVQQIDTFTTVAARIGGSLTALVGLLTAAQEELDRAWDPVAVVPYELVGTERVLVLHPASTADEELVRSATEAAKAIRGRLDVALDAESARLRDARMELAAVRIELVQIVGGDWPVGVPGLVGDLGRSVSGGESTTWDGTASVGTPGTTSVSGAAAGGGVAGAAAGGAAAAPVLPAIVPVSFDAPDLTGLSAAALAGGAGLAAAAARRGRKQEPQAASGGAGTAPMGGMAAGAAMRGGTLGRPGGAGGSGGSTGSAGPRAGKPLRAEQESVEEAARAAREKEEAREAKRQLIAERQAERAARRAQREASKEGAIATEVVQVSGEDGSRRRE